ncbi:MAG: uroporphyrinogen-III synthase [Burkholderiaceae bacterium]
MNGTSGAPAVDRRATLFVTRPERDAGTLIAALRGLGRTVVSMPVIAIEPVADPARLARTMAHLETYGLVVFVSPNAIRQALAHRAAPWPSDVTIGVMGPGSVDVLRGLGIDAPRVRVVRPAALQGGGPGERFDSEGLFVALEETIGLKHDFAGSVLILRGNGGRAWFAERLQSLGIAVDQVEAYRRVRPEADAGAAEALDRLFASGDPVAFVVTSSEGVDNLLEIVERSLMKTSLVSPARVRAWLFGCAIVAPHPRIAERARESGFSRVSLCASGDRGIVAAIE